MKNITVVVADESYLQARIWAARRQTSVSALVRRRREDLDAQYCPVLNLPDRGSEAISLPPISCETVKL